MKEYRGALFPLIGELRGDAGQLQRRFRRMSVVPAAALLLLLVMALTGCDDENFGVGYTPQGLAFTDTDDGLTLGGIVTITPGSSAQSIEAYRLYFGGSTPATAKLALIGSAAADTATPIVIIAAGTEIPSGATHFWVFPVVKGVEVEFAASLEISNHISAPVPMLFSLTPNQGTPGGAYVVTLMGAGFESDATVELSGSGSEIKVEAGDVTIVSAGSITARFTIEAESAPGEIGVTVTTAGGSSIAQAFTICDEGATDCGALDGGWAYGSLRADSGTCDAPVGPSPGGPLTGRVAYVLDISRSMATSFTIDGQPSSRSSVLRQIWFDEVDRLVNTPSFFNAIIFNETLELWRPNLQFASSTNVLNVKTWFDSPVSEGPPRRDLAPGGNTNGAYGALERAFNQTGVETIVFISDGFPSGPDNDPLNIIDTSITQWNPSGRVILHAIGVTLGGQEDKAQAASFMKALAEANGGCFVQYEADPVAP